MLTWADLRGRAVGLVSAMARPERVLRDLSAHGVEPRVCLRAPDHGPIGATTFRACRAATREKRVDLWLATAKCMLHVERRVRFERGGSVAAALGAPAATLEYSVVPVPALCARLRGIAVP
jgi:tetraacyldisaccharide-1-P 4'-kinase